MRWCIICVLLIASAQASTLMMDLAAYWNFDDDTLDDLSVNGFDGVAVGAVTFVDAQSEFYGRAIELDGAGNNDNYVNVLSGGALTGQASGELTISAWFRVNSFTKTWQTLIAQGEGSSWRIQRFSNSEAIAPRVGGGELNDGSQPDINDGQWHQIVATAGPGGRNHYVDGVLVASAPGPVSFSAVPNIWIGNNPGNIGRTWDGLIDDVAIWTRVLTTDELNLLFVNPLHVILYPRTE